MSGKVVRSLTWPQVLTWRLGRHSLLSAQPLDHLVELVGELCGIHAQVAATAELSIGLRVGGADREHVRRERWGRRVLVKTYGPRGTLHLFPARELGFWLAALRAARPAARAEREANQLERTDTTREQLAEMVAAMEMALDGQMLTREELGAAVEERAGAWAADRIVPAFADRWPRWTLALAEATASGVVCFGPPAGNRVRFVRVDQWLGPLAHDDGRGALAELLRRYLRAYGPSTTDEFAQWAAVDPPMARALAASLGDGLAQVAVEGERRWVVAADADEAWPAPDASVHLLPAFDVYVIGSRPRDVLVPPAHARRARNAGKAHTFDRSGRASLAGSLPVLLVDGVVSGVWQRHLARGRLEIGVEPFVELDARRRRQVVEAAERVGAVLRSPVDVSIGPVDVRPHL